MYSWLQQHVSEYRTVQRVLYGLGARKSIGVEARRLTQGNNCLLIADRGVVEVGLVGDIKDALKDQSFTVTMYDKGEPEPTVPTYTKGLQFAENQRPDVVIGIGGGSSIDLSKAISHALTNPGPLEDHIGKEFSNVGIPLIAVPTTAGTGAEVTPDAVVLHGKIKTAFFNARPTVAIVDPELTVTLPPRLTAATGIDALAHAIESVLSKTSTPLTRATAFEAIQLISTNLRQAVYEGDNLEARANMACAALMEGFSEGNAGDVEGHAVGSLIGGYYGIHHGEACGIALPYCMKYNLPVNVPLLARIATAMDESISGTQRQKAECGIRAVFELTQETGLPTSISDIPQAKEEDFPELVHLYCTHPNITGILELFAKRGIPSEAEATAFFHDMFKQSFTVSGPFE